MLCCITMQVQPVWLTGCTGVQHTAAAIEIRCLMHVWIAAVQGAAVVRMFRFLLGPENFQNGVQTFFNNNDGKVSTGVVGIGVACRTCPAAAATCCQLGMTMA